MVKDGPGIEVPLPHAEAPSSAPRILFRRPFLWLVLTDGVAGLARWALFLAVVGDATYRLRASPGEVALVLASFSLPYILVSPLHGALADRWSAKWLLVITVGLSAGAATIPLATGSLGALYVTAAAFGVMNAAQIPARGALIPRLVPADRLVQANGMVSAALAVQLIIGPTLAAVLVRFLGPDAPYLVTLTAAGMATLLSLLIPDRRAAAPGTGSGFADVAAGFAEGWRTPALRRLFLLAVSVWFLIGMLIVLEPAYLREELGQGQVFLGVLWAVYGGGEVLGSLILARMRKGSGREPALVAGGLLLAAVGFLIYASIRSPVAVIAGNVVFGLGFPFFTATSQALIQRLARFPGQVSAAFSMAGEAGPVGAAALLTMAGGRVSVRAWLLGSGVAFVLVALASLRLARRDG